MSVWYWVRHGPTHAKSFVGWRDLPADLSDTAALGRLSRWLPKDALVVSSDLVRSVATADAIADGRVRLPHEPGLREFDFGLWDGMHFDDVSAAYPELSRAYWEQPGDIRPPEGESWNEAATRIRAAVDAIERKAEGRPVIAVAHFGTILTQVQHVTGQSARDVLVHKIDNLSVTRLDRRDGSALINHLP